MKKSRAARDGSALKQVVLPPPLPAFEELDALAASESPTVESAWWISYQVSEHVFSTVAHSDPRTGEPLPRPLTDILRDLREATETGCRPFPRDRLLSSAEFAADSIEHLLDRHRHRIVRVHEQLPLHQLREVDTRSMAWLARQSGRNIREKLSGRTHALGVKRDVSADTTENRLLMSFAKLLVQRAGNRLAFTSAYDGTADDAERARRLDDCMRLCDERLRRSELAAVPTLARLQPNNVLLSDAHYSRVYRAWQWLRADEETLRSSWKDALQRSRVLLCWMVAAQIAIRERMVIAETLGRALTGRDDGHRLGVEILGAEAAGPDWVMNPPLLFLVLPAGCDDAVFRIRMTLEGEFIRAQIATLAGRGLLREEPVSTVAFRVRPTFERLQPQRGIEIAVDGLDIFIRGAERTYADLAGLKPLATQMARQILQRCYVNPNIEKRERAPVVIKEGARLGIELGNTSLHVCADQAIPLTTSSWALALDLPGDTSGLEWLDGRGDRELVVGASGRSLWTSGDVLDGAEHADAGMVALAADRLLGSVASELDVPADARVAFAVPDSVDEFSQRSLRSAFGALFHRPVPVWRSIAAAMSWTSSAVEHGPRSGDTVVVVDTEFACVSLTVLTAREDAQLAKTHPTSRGIYWERRPPLPPDEWLEMLGWPHLLRAYARMLVVRELPALQSELQERLVEDLLRSGRIASLVTRGGSILVQIPSTQFATPDVVEFFEDPAWLDAETARWTDRLGQCVQGALATLGTARVLLIGGPCSYPRFLMAGRQFGRINWFDEEKGFGRIAVGKSETDVFFHINSVQVADGVDLRKDLAVEFDVGEGRKGPEAQRVTSIPWLKEWLRQRTVVTPQGLATGARECLLRLDTGSLTWREWLPELSLEVVRDGHFGELPLLESGTFVDPFLGEAVQFTVPETLTLARGQPWFSFPLRVGRQGRRPIAWEARLDSAAFPLDHDVHARLKLSYRYGLDKSYDLAVEPASPDDAPFARVEAKWIKGGEDSKSPPTRQRLTLQCMPWDPAGASSFLEAAGSLQRLGNEKYDRFLFAVTRSCWSQGRSLTAAPPEVQRNFPDFSRHLMEALPPELNVEDIPFALEVLVLLHEDAPSEVIGWLLDLDSRAADQRVQVDGGAPVPLYRQTAIMLAMLVGNGKGERAALLQRLLDRLRRHGQGDGFDAQLAGLSMRALSTAAWRHPAFIGSLAAAPGGVALVIDRCRRSLYGLLGRIYVSEEHEKIARLYGTPFRDVCELLLALMAIDSSDPVVAPLQTGSSSADGFAKLIRQIDARLASVGATPRWNVRLDVHVPKELHRMSPVAFALNQYLADGAGANLVYVADAELS